MRRLLIAVLFASLALPGALISADSATAFSKKEIADAAYHWGRVDYAGENCARLGVNATLKAETLTVFESAGEDAWKSGYELGQAEAKEYFEGAGADAFCQLAWVFYGRDGQNIKNLLVRE